MDDRVRVTHVVSSTVTRLTATSGNTRLISATNGRLGRRSRSGVWVGSVYMRRCVRPRSASKQRLSMDRNLVDRQASPMRPALLALAACATDGALHAEPIVTRAVCAGTDVGAFGHGDDATCRNDVVALGDGCYLAPRADEDAPRLRQRTRAGTWAPHLFQCAPNAPDGHVMCVEDALPPRDDIFAATPPTVT